MNGLAPRLSDRMWTEANATLKIKGRSFYWARHGLSTLHARRATRLYSFCRLIDDLADVSTSSDQARRALLTISQSIAGGCASDDRVNDMLGLMAECGIEPLVVQELIAGVTSDLDVVEFEDVDELLHYCYQVAGTVGLMMCRVLGVQSRAALPHAIDLGIAMQLTNICRDVSEDAAAGRRYLPTSLIGNIAPSDLISPQADIQPLARQCLATLLDLADQHYRNGERGLAYLPLKACVGILVAGRLYRAIGSGLRRRGHDYWSGRLVVPSWQKFWLTAAALTVRLVRPDFWCTPRRRFLAHVNSSQAMSATPPAAGGKCANRL